VRVVPEDEQAFLEEDDEEDWDEVMAALENPWMSEGAAIGGSSEL